MTEFIAKDAFQLEAEVVSTTTSSVRAFFQTMLNTVLANSQDKSPMKVSVLSFDFMSGRKDKRGIYIPFLLILPKSAQKQNKQNEKDDIDPVFDTGNQSSKLQLRDEIFALLKPFMYRKDDLHYLESGDMRRTLGLTQPMLANIRKYSQPTPVKSGDNNSNVIIMLDPIKVLRGMLVNKENKSENFRVVVTDCIYLNKNQFKYVVSREQIRRNINDSDDAIAKRLLAQVNSYNR